MGRRSFAVLLLLGIFAVGGLSSTRPSSAETLVQQNVDTPRRAGVSSPSVAATEIQFWHAMTAVAGERVNDMAAKFNASQSDFVVKAVHKESYAETLPAAIAANQKAAVDQMNAGKTTPGK